MVPSLNLENNEDSGTYRWDFIREEHRFKSLQGPSHSCCRCRSGGSGCVEEGNRRVEEGCFGVWTGLQPDGEVDRLKLAQIVFSDPEKRQTLNRLLAPYISFGIFWEISKLWLKGFKVIVLDIPLLFEAKMDRWTKPVIVVWVDPETQLERLMVRDSTSKDDAQNRINAQMSLDEKRNKADIVIDNTGSREDLQEKFKSVLFEVTKPLTWIEFWLSRQGALCALVSITIGTLMFRKVYYSSSRL